MVWVEKDQKEYTSSDPAVVGEVRLLLARHNRLNLSRQLALQIEESREIVTELQRSVEKQLQLQGKELEAEQHRAAAEVNRIQEERARNMHADEKRALEERREVDDAVRLALDEAARANAGKEHQNMARRIADLESQEAERSRTFRTEMEAMMNRLMREGKLKPVQ